MFFPLYAFGCPHNFFELQTSLYLLAGLVVLVGSQVFLLKAQDRWGTRFFIPKMVQIDYYNYHQHFYIDPDDDEICAICMTDIISSKEDLTYSYDKVDGGKWKYIAKNVLTTPCNHRFCHKCLIRWMESKMICPTCRGKIPPYIN